MCNSWQQHSQHSPQLQRQVTLTFLTGALPSCAMVSMSGGTGDGVVNDTTVCGLLGLDEMSSARTPKLQATIQSARTPKLQATMHWVQGPQNYKQQHTECKDPKITSNNALSARTPKLQATMHWVQGPQNYKQQCTECKDPKTTSNNTLSARTPTLQATMHWVQGPQNYK